MKLLFLGFCIYATVLVENASSQPQGVVGGYSPIPADDEDVRQLALFSLTSIAQQSGSKRSLGLIRVLSAKSQIVAGTNYKINLMACEKDSTDEKNSAVDKKSCRKCDVTIWEQIWLNKKTVTDVSCSKPDDLASFSDFSSNN